MAGGPEFVIVAGSSGAGRSTAANALEDVGWFVIDNLPPHLIGDVADMVARPGARLRRVVLVAGTREYREDLVTAIRQLRERNASVRVVYLDAPTAVLVRRYDDTRRRHPLHTGDQPVAVRHSRPSDAGSSDTGPPDAGPSSPEPVAESVIDAIELERELLADVRGIADVVIDTGDLNVHELRDRVREEIGTPGDDPHMRAAVTSFGYKHGVPPDADLVFDCRFLPNPHWVPELRHRTGLDPSVREWVLAQPATGVFLAHLVPMLQELLPWYRNEGKSYLTIAFGCTGGRHRSVAIAEHVARLVLDEAQEPACRHRDIAR
ncbi:RNase adapter RapZ [Candidatus Poriferisodalis sp.]|uniref:RNase adapter RapZ n=1 Tax=Candidatus Poriferisodalis sp. TaxID=3101277 RepID=UPI003B01957A